MSDKRKELRKRILVTIPLSLMLIFLLSFATFSWIKREFSPSIEEDELSIATAGALVFQFSGTGEVTTNKTVNEILGVSNFELKPSSNLKGNPGEFFNINYDKDAGKEEFKHLNFTKEGYSSEMALGIANGFAVMSFTIVSEKASEADVDTRYIYLSSASLIADVNQDDGIDVSKCVRVAINVEYEDPTLNKTYIIGVEDPAKLNSQDGLYYHKGITNKQIEDGVFAADGTPVYKSYELSTGTGELNTTIQGIENGEPLQESTRMYLMSDVDGGTYDGADNLVEFDVNQTLFKLIPGQKQRLTVCIWIEGEDALCNDQIADLGVKLLLKFESYTVSE